MQEKVNMALTHTVLLTRFVNSWPLPDTRLHLHLSSAGGRKQTELTVRQPREASPYHNTVIACSLYLIDHAPVPKNPHISQQLH